MQARALGAGSQSQSASEDGLEDSRSVPLLREAVPPRPHPRGSHCLCTIVGLTFMAWAIPSMFCLAFCILVCRLCRISRISWMYSRTPGTRGRAGEREETPGPAWRVALGGAPGNFLRSPGARSHRGP